jgi:hypothetical protein
LQRERGFRRLPVADGRAAHGKWDESIALLQATTISGASRNPSMLRAI